MLSTMCDEFENTMSKQKLMDMYEVKFLNISLKRLCQQVIHSSVLCTPSTMDHLI